MASASTSVAPALTALSGSDFLSSSDFSAEQTSALLQLAAQLKHGDRRIDLGNRVLGLIFTKASTRTRVSFWWRWLVSEARPSTSIPRSPKSVEASGTEDTARVLSRFCSMCWRSAPFVELADYALGHVHPHVINALTDLEHYGLLHSPRCRKLSVICKAEHWPISVTATMWRTR